MKYLNSILKRMVLPMSLVLVALAPGCKSGDEGRDPILGGGGHAIYPPMVLSVTPLNGAMGVPISNTVVTATFSEAMAPISGTATFTVTCAAPGASPTGQVTLNAAGTMATFTPTPGTTLTPESRFTAKITGARSLAHGIALANPYEWSFTTGPVPDTTRPRVQSTVPGTSIPGPTLGVSIASPISATFTEAMDPTTLHGGSVRVEVSASGVPLNGGVNYAPADRTVTFLPTAQLTYDTTYTATLTTAITDLAGNALAGNQGSLPGPSSYIWTFRTPSPPDTTRPRVTLTNPSTAVPPNVGLPVNAAIAAAFTEDMAPATLTGNTFLLTGPGGSAIAGRVGYASRTAVFTPSVLLASDTTYTATITSGATDLAGNALAGNQAPLLGASDYIWSFRTGPAPDTTRPRVTLTVPPTASPIRTNVPINTTIAAAFTEDMAPTTISGATFTVKGPGGAAIPGGVSYASRTAVFAPAVALASETTYTATITMGATDLAGNALAGNMLPLPSASNYEWSFRTGPAPDTTRPRVTLTVPVTMIPGRTEVARNSAVAAAFTEDMAPSTLTTSSFYLTGPGGALVAGGVSYASRIAVFTPVGSLASSTTYTATITVATTDLAGNALAGNQAPLPGASNYIWTFTTGAADDTAPPQVTLTVPATTVPGPTEGAATNTSIAAAFTEDMDPSTLNLTSFTVSGPGGAVVGSVSYASRTAVFTAAAGLATSTTYTATITFAARDLAGNRLSGNQAAYPGPSNYIWTFTTDPAPDTTRPRVTLTNPITTLPGPTAGAPTNTAITAAFTEAMDPITISLAHFTVAGPGGVPLAGTVTYASGAATFHPTVALAANTTYTATVTSGATDLAGNALAGNQAPLPAASNYVWTFTTDPIPDTTRPRITLTVPATTLPGPTLGVPFNTAITAAFTEDMIPGTITGASFTVKGPGGVPVAGSVTYAARMATFTPSALLAASTTFTAMITVVATDLSGNELAGNQAPLPSASNYIWTFTTDAAPDTTRPRVTLTVPATTAPGPTTGVAFNTAITAAFTEDMLPATINGTSFTLTTAGVDVAGGVTYAARTAIFTPVALLLADTTYTATVTLAAKDLAGNALAGNQAPLPAASNYVWTFRTGPAPDTTRPRVTLTVPATTIPGPTTGMPTNTAITAAFTEDMAPATLTAATFKVTGPGGVLIAGGVSYAARMAVFTPVALLLADTVYTATVTMAAKDLAGNALAGNQAPLPAASDYVWTFRTAAPIPPADITVFSTKPAAGAINVCPTATINATFAVPSGLRMDPATVNTATFTLTAPGPVSVIAASVVLDAATGQTATFTPLNPLTNGVTYQATLKGGATGVKDLAIPANRMISDKIWSFTAGPATGVCLTPPALGAIQPFGAFGGSAGMTNQGVLTVINGDIGTTAVSTAVTGFHNAGGGCEYTETPLNIGFVNGNIYTAPPPPTVACPSQGTAVTFAIATAARAAGLAAYNALVAMPMGPDPGAGNLGSLVLAPGVYTAASGSFMIRGGNLTLDAQGDPNATWVFQMATTLTVGGPGAAFPQSVTLVGGAQAKNVFWQVGSFATINAGGGGTMVGTIIAQAGVSISTAGNVALATLNGRALSLGASVTVVNTIINVPPM